MPIRTITLASCLVALAGPPALGQAPPAPAPAEPAPVAITAKLRTESAALAPIVTAPLAKEFLAATAELAEPGPRTVYRNRDRTAAASKREFDAMPPERQAEFAPREYPPSFYYETGYGSPLVFVRLLDLAAPHAKLGERPKLLDFGYGSIGQLQLLARRGFDAHGVDVERVFPALYSEPGDTGPTGRGTVSIHCGQWPADPKLAAAIGTGHSLITSKNTLKEGYIHPKPPPGQTVDPAKLVHLGVDDGAFLAAVHGALAPGGLFVIYNICPPQNPPDKPYIPWADGKSPFSPEAFQKAGFEVLAFDVEDQPWVLECFDKLGYGEGKTIEQLAKEYFCWYTIVRKK